MIVALAILLGLALILICVQSVRLGGAQFDVDYLKERALEYEADLDDAWRDVDAAQEERDVAQEALAVLQEQIQGILNSASAPRTSVLPRSLVLMKTDKGAQAFVEQTEEDGLS